MKADFKIFDYVSFPADKGSEEIREGFIYQIHQTQVDLVSVRKKDGNTFGDFGFHKKYLEKERWKEVKHIEINRNIKSWRLYRVIAWAMVRLFQTYGEFKTEHIKAVIVDTKLAEAVKINALVEAVGELTIQFDRKTKRQV